MNVEFMSFLRSNAEPVASGLSREIPDERKRRTGLTNGSEGNCEATAIVVRMGLRERELAEFFKRSGSRFSAFGTVVCRARLVAVGAQR